MIGRFAEAIGFVLGLAVGILLSLFWFVSSRVSTTVVQYQAHDYEYGDVIVEVRSNRLTGRKTRWVYEDVDIEEIAR